MYEVMQMEDEMRIILTKVKTLFSLDFNGKIVSGNYQGKKSLSKRKGRGGNEENLLPTSKIYCRARRSSNNTLISVITLSYK
jgi:hypothetical protein